MVADGAELCRRFRPDAVRVEAHQIEELLFNELASEFSPQDVTYNTPAAIHNHIGKLVRIRRIGPYLSQRRLRFLSNSPSTRQLVNQLRDFPSGAHDDGPDALEMALRLAEDVVHGLTTSDGLGDRLPVG
jgi:predicted phage terminase large subunit-like protein